MPIQTATEEILFRGYLLQGLFKLTKNKWVALIIVTILFAFAHIFNPEFKNNFFPVITAYLTFSLLFGLITLIDDGLELPMGIHAANNLFVAVILSASGGVFSTPSIFKTSTQYLIEVLPALLILMSIMTSLTLQYIYKWNFKSSSTQ